MAQKNFLKELLKEDQEPFQLKDYIADRKCQLQKQTSLRESSQHIAKPHHHQQQQQIQLLKKPKNPITTAGGTTKSISTNFCKSACFFSSKFHESPDFRKSPLFEFPSPLQGSYKSPCRAGCKSSPLFLHVPAKTATLLLEAAMRIQQKQTNPSSKSSNTTHLKSSGFRLFGSMIKRLANRKRGSSSSSSSGREELVKDNNNGEIVRWAASGRRSLSREDIDILDENEIRRERLITSVCSTGTGTRTTSTSCSSNSSICRFEDDEDNYEFVNVLGKENDSNNYGLIDDDFGLCPVSSPFRFALYKSPSPDHHHHHHQYYNRRSPVFFSSPAAKSSPTRRKFQDTVNYEQSVKFQAEEEEEDDKEQNSPVSILDPPFEDDDQGHDDDEEDGYDLDCSYAFVQRAKQQLLRKLHRFEKLAELDPLELDRKMAEEQEEDYDDYDLNEDEEENETYMNGFVREMITKSCYEEIQKPGMKRLLSDIITYEEQDIMDNDDPETALALVKRVCTRLDSWKQVESNTIDMMVGIDLKREGDFWKNHKEQISETAMEIELHIFAVLVDELTGELVC